MIGTASSWCLVLTQGPEACRALTYRIWLLSSRLRSPDGGGAGLCDMDDASSSITVRSTSYEAAAAAARIASPHRQCQGCTARTLALGIFSEASSWGRLKLHTAGAEAMHVRTLQQTPTCPACTRTRTSTFPRPWQSSSGPPLGSPDARSRRAIFSARTRSKTGEDPGAQPAPTPTSTEKPSAAKSVHDTPTPRGGTAQHRLKLGRCNVAGRVQLSSASQGSLGNPDGRCSAAYCTSTRRCARTPYIPVLPRLLVLFLEAGMDGTTAPPFTAVSGR